MYVDLPILQGAVALVVASSGWLIWRRYLASNPLDNIPGPPSQSFWSGNLVDISGLFGWSYHEMLFQRYGGIVKFTGLFGSRALSVSDATALHHILIKDSTYWKKSDMILTNDKLVFGNGLLATIGDQHRKQRKMLNPAFSTAHLRHMIPALTGITSTLRDSIAKQMNAGRAEIDIQEWFTRTALELIGQTGLGYSFDSLKGPDSNPYSKVVKNLTPTLMKVNVQKRFLPALVKYSSAKFRRTVAEMIPWAMLQELLSMVDLMDKTSVDLLNEKRKAIAEGDDALVQQVGQGKDIMSILLKANLNASEEDRLTDDELVGQVTTLIFTATDTTSGALSRTIHILSQHPEVQEKLREEYKEIKGDRDAVTYDDLVNLPYLDAVCRETLRLYPPVPNLIRETTRDIVLPFANPIKGLNGKEVNEVLVPKDTFVILSLVGANCNKDVWGEDAMQWKPERWLQPIPSTVTEAQIPGVYSHLMTFSGGGNSCIGFKFSQLEMKIVLSMLLESFKFSPASGYEIEWTMGVSAPSVKGSQDKPHRLPIMVELLNGAD